MATLIECMKYAKQNKNLTEDERKLVGADKKTNTDTFYKKFTKTFAIKKSSWERPNDIPIIAYITSTGGPCFKMPESTCMYENFVDSKDFVISCSILEENYEKFLGDKDKTSYKMIKSISHMVFDYTNIASK